MHFALCRPVASDVTLFCRNSMCSRLLKSAVLWVASSIMPCSTLAAPENNSGAGRIAAISSVMSVRYIPATPSVVPDAGKSWEASADEIIKATAATSKLRASASDIYYESRRAGLDANTLLILVELLSRFDEMAVSRSGNVGLLQLSPSLHAQLGNPANTLYQGKYNLRLGCTVLRLYLDQNAGNMERAIARFFLEASPQPDPKERTRDFIKLLGARRSTLVESR